MKHPSAYSGTFGELAKAIGENTARCDDHESRLKALEAAAGIGDEPDIQPDAEPDAGNGAEDGQDGHKGGEDPQG